jgi:acyl transferase domain-containing protein/acyl carrier protein
LLPLSAHTPEALHDLGAAYHDLLVSANGTLPDIRSLCAAAATRRSHHAYRLAVVADTPHTLRERLAAFTAGEPAGATTLVGTEPARHQPPLVFVYTGMGPQWWGMGTQLLQQEPVFREAVEACDAVFQRMAGWSLFDLFPLRATGSDESARPMGEPAIAQPANFALQVGLTALWKAYGLQPDAVVGHSTGEIAAAYAAGSLSLEDAVRVTYERSRLQQTTVGQGTMLAVGLSEDDVQPYLEPYRERVSLAVINGPHSLTLAGAPADLHALAQTLNERSIFHRMLKVEVAYHSLQMEPLRDEFLPALTDIAPGAPHLPLYSTVTGQQVAPGEQDAVYWWNNLRGTVYFKHAMDNLLQDGYTTFLEIGPHPVLATGINESMQAHKVVGSVVSSQRRQQDERVQMLQALGALYNRGCAIDWAALYPQRHHITLPAYPWQREELWNETAASWRDRCGSFDHPLLQNQQATPAPTWETDLSIPRLTYLRDHCLDGVVLFPGAGYVESGLALAGSDPTVVALDNLQFHRALGIDNTPLLRVTLDPNTQHFSIASRPLQDDTAWTRHAGGSLVRGTPGRRFAQIDLAVVQNRCPASATGAEVYSFLHTRGLQYGAAFRGIRQVWWGHDEVVAELDATAHIESNGTYRLHPTLLDSAFQTLVLLAEGLQVPVHIRHLRVHSPIEGTVWSYCRVLEHTAAGLTGDLLLCDEAGNVLVEVLGLQVQPIAPVRPAVPDATLDDLFHTFVWEAAEPVAAETQPATGTWLVFADEGGGTNQIAAQMDVQGIPYIQVRRGDALTRHDDRTFTVCPERAADVHALLATLNLEALAGVVYGWSLDTTTASDDVSRQTGLSDSLALIFLVQALTQHTISTLQRFCVLTRTSQPVIAGEPVRSASGHALWGLGRVISNEHPGLRCCLVDLDVVTPEHAALLLAELATSGDETEIALRRCTRYVHRLVQTADDTPGEQTATPATGYALVIGTPGVIDSLEYRETGRRAPAAGEVEIEVHASGLNFKDVMKVMGLLDAQYLSRTFFQDTLGMECAGVVVAVGAGVSDYQMGDPVHCFAAQGSFRSYLTVATEDIAPLPEALSFVDSTSFITFMTAWYGLHDLGRLQPGERVLIHAATGGVGLAAIQIAQRLGATIYATAGSPEKRAHLHSLGVEYVSDSRSLQFVDDVHTWTGGVGVDVVLNSLSGELLAASFDLLAPFGRFIELGKRDINDNNRLAMAAFDRNLIFAAVDLDLIAAQRPELMRRLRDTVLAQFARGDLHPVPVVRFSATEVVAAFRLMSQARHIGKIVVELAHQPVTLQPRSTLDVAVSADATYLITGGLGGFGLEVAHWLVQQGVRHLVLIGRSGAATVAARQAVQHLERQGAQVTVMQADVGQRAQVERVLHTIRTTLPPLRGVFHAAMVLADATLAQLTREQVDQIMLPKALGAWHLHELTQTDTLDCFVLFSSISALVGNPGQASYAAANAFLDGLAHARHTQGLPALSINWGALHTVGVLARDENTASYLARLGIEALAPAEATQALGLLLTRPAAAQMGVMRVNWSVWAQGAVASARAPRYEHLLATAAADTTEADTSVRSVLLTTIPEERGAVAEAFVCTLVSRIVRLPADRIDPQLGLDRLGIDSLLAVELAHAIKADSGIDVPTMLIVQGIPISQLAAYIVGQVQVDDDGLLEQVANLSEAELDAILAQSGAAAS